VRHKKLRRLETEQEHYSVYKLNAMLRPVHLIQKTY